MRNEYQKVNPMATRQAMTGFWLCAWALALGISWVLPNHYPPWSTFHMDAWSAIVFSLAAAAVIWRVGGPVIWQPLAILMALLALLPGLQYALGMLMFAGTAWVSSAYVLGFMLALLVGARWESASPGQAADGLFLAIGMASLLSVGLQLHQWLALGLLDIWSMGDGFGRPFANFGQPNQLGTFLLWGVLAAAWGLLRRRMGVWTFLLMAAFLLFGLALTQSRTAWLALILLLVASWVWRGLWPDRRWPWLLAGLGAFFVACVLSVDRLSEMLLLASGGDFGGIARISGELRPTVWALFLDAAWRQPWLGYGWSQVGLAQLAAALDYPTVQSLFSHSHNLFLDLVLWCGIPVGLAVTVFLLRWFWLRLRAVRAASDAVLLMFLLVVGNHAMLELPLHHAYFLLPAGLVMGALDMRLGARPRVATGRWSLVALWMLAVPLLALLIRDYARVEPSYQALRFEWARIKYQKRGEPPEVLLLDQWREFIRLARFEPTRGMSADDLELMRKVTSTYPSAGFFQKYAAALAMNQRPEEAQLWLRKLCKMVTEAQCLAVRAAWENHARIEPLIAAVRWPD